MAELSQSIQDDIRAVEEGWCTSAMSCAACGSTQVSIFPVECAIEKLQCVYCRRVGTLYFKEDDDAP